MTKLNVVEKTSPTQSEPRAILAAAIKAARDAKIDELDKQEALERTKRHRSDAVRRLDQASAAVDEAKNAFAAEMALSREDRAPVLNGAAIQDARAAISRAQDVVDAASQAIALMEPLLLKAEYVARIAAEKVKLAAHAVAEAEVTRLLDEAKKARAEFVRAASSLGAVVGHLHIPWMPVPSVDEAKRWFETSTYFGNETANSESPKWQRFFIDLLEDANTPFPD